VEQHRERYYDFQQAWKNILGTYARFGAKEYTVKLEDLPRPGTERHIIPPSWQGWRDGNDPRLDSDGQPDPERLYQVKGCRYRLDRDPDEPGAGLYTADDGFAYYEHSQVLPERPHYALAYHVIRIADGTDAVPTDHRIALAAELAKRVGELRVHLGIRTPVQCDALQAVDSDGTLSLDRRFAEYLSTPDLGDAGKGRARAFTDGATARTQQSQQPIEGVGDDLALAFRGWLNSGPTEPGSDPTPTWSPALNYLTWALWVSVVKPRIERERERAKHNFPGHQLESARTLAMQSSKRTQLIFEDVFEVAFLDGATMTVPDKHGGVYLGALHGRKGGDWPPSRPNGRRLMYAVARKINAAHADGWPKDVDTQFEFTEPGENDWPAVARWAGMEGTAQEGVDVRATAVAMLAPVWEMSDGRVGNLCTRLRDGQIHTGKRQAITLHFASDFARLVDEHGKVVPIPNHDPPLLPYRPTHGATFGVQIRLFIKLREHATDLASKGHVKITETEWRGWLEDEGFPKSYVKAPRRLIDRWLCQGDWPNEGDAMIIEPKPWHFTLAAPRWENNLSQILEGGARSLKASKGGKAKSNARQSGAPRAPRRRKRQKTSPKAQ
jgi:hypothetical protein